MVLNWNDKKLLGRGGNASVYSIPNNNGERVAVKVSRAKKKD